MRKLLTFSLFVSIAFCSLSILSDKTLAAESVEEIIVKANNVAYYEGKDGRSNVKMTIADSQGRTRIREFTILRFDIADGKEQKYYVYFNKPADVQDMVYMVWKYTDKDDDRWMYLPALDLVRRIASSDKRSSFVGSNFVYEDISGRGLALDNHELLSSEGDIYKIKNTPKDAADVEFSYFEVYIQKSNFMPVKAQYYDKQGKLYKTVEALEIKDINGHPTVIKSKATDLTAGSYTVIEFSKVEYDLGFEDDIFTERYLRRPPRKWLN
ncbi:MAG: outer membrane lipoprotein-sorting protein [Candidatus Omnitrophota bacterium]